MEEDVEEEEERVEEEESHRGRLYAMHNCQPINQLFIQWIGLMSKVYKGP